METWRALHVRGDLVPRSSRSETAEVVGHPSLWRGPREHSSAGCFRIAQSRRRACCTEMALQVRSRRSCDRSGRSGTVRPLPYREEPHDHRRRCPASWIPLQIDPRQANPKLESEVAARRRGRVGRRITRCEPVSSRIVSAFGVDRRLELGPEQPRSTAADCVRACTPLSPDHRHHAAIDPRRHGECRRSFGLDHHRWPLGHSAPSRPIGIKGCQSLARRPAE